MTNKNRDKGLWPSDSNITVLRLRTKQKRENKRRAWQGLEGIILLGDGKHLGETPSLVNLVNLVEKEDCSKVTMLPVSSWEPGQASSSSSEASLEYCTFGRKNCERCNFVFLLPRRSINRSASEPIIYREPAEEPLLLDSDENATYPEILKRGSEELYSENVFKSLDCKEGGNKIKAFKQVFKSCFPFLFKRKYDDE